MYYFPHPYEADADGLLAIGGDLSPERLLLAYRFGIFPWYSEPPILWWHTHPRCVLFPSDLQVSKSMRSLIRKDRFCITYNHAFEQVIDACREIHRPGQPGTWISHEVLEAYTELHHMGYAHSVEVWDDDRLVGGLYGLAIGHIFFGESMFARESNASKYGFIHLVRRLEELNFWLIDCQQETRHLMSLGAQMIPRDDFWSYLKKNLLVDRDRVSLTLPNK